MDRPPIEIENFLHFNYNFSPLNYIFLLHRTDIQKNVSHSHKSREIIQRIHSPAIAATTSPITNLLNNRTGPFSGATAID